LRDGRIIGEFCDKYLLGPVGARMRAVQSEQLLYGLISPLWLAVSLRPTCSGEIEGDSEETVQLLPKLRDEELVSIRNNGDRKTMDTKNFMKEDWSKLLGSNLLRAWNEMSHLGKSINDCEDGVIGRGLR
jgi:hypothetical protein